MTVAKYDDIQLDRVMVANGTILRIPKVRVKVVSSRGTCGKILQNRPLV